MASRRAPPTSSKKTTAPAPAPAKARPATAGKKASAREQPAKVAAPKPAARAKVSPAPAKEPAARPPARKAGSKAPAKAGKVVRTRAPAAPKARRKPAAAAAPELAGLPPAAPLSSEEDPSALAKLAVSEEAAAAEPKAAHIPWSYGLDRVTAAAVDPERLFAYWEVTDQAIERAREALGAGGAGAWLCLRVHDTTGLIFDGTNAHGTFEHGVDRGTRQWFFHVGKPDSSAFVEVGLRAPDGRFAAIARSGRVDFPRRQPAPWRDPEWMTVQPWSGAVADVHRAPQAAPGAGPGGGPRPAGRHAPPPGGAPPLPERFEQIPLWVMREPGESFQVWMRQALEQGFERVEWEEASGQGWFALEGRVEWESPVVFSTWEAGPFSHPVEIAPPSREEWTGHSFAFRVGAVTHVVHGPWKVVIRNLGARAERAVLGAWTITRSWAVEGGRELRVGPVPTRGVLPAPGASEQRLGASERRWQSGSELRLGGASEVWRIGASELAFRGASERLYLGGSERVARGASERQYAGASERRLGGASEQRWAGASEARLGGASEQRLGGASEGRLAPAGEALPYPAAPPASNSSEE
jgi:hypothetical protein